MIMRWISEVPSKIALTRRWGSPPPTRPGGGGSQTPHPDQLPDRHPGRPGQRGPPRNILTGAVDLADSIGLAVLAGRHPPRGPATRHNTHPRRLHGLGLGRLLVRDLRSACSAHGWLSPIRPRLARRMAAWCTSLQARPITQRGSKRPLSRILKADSARPTARPIRGQQPAEGPVLRVSCAPRDPPAYGIGPNGLAPRGRRRRRARRPALRRPGVTRPPPGSMRSAR
jgi:hypothetical protein